MIAQYPKVSDSLWLDALLCEVTAIAHAPCMHGQAQAETSCACWHVLGAPVDPASSLAAALVMNDVQPHAVDGQTPNQASRSAGTAPRGSPRLDTKQFSSVYRPHCARRIDPAASRQLHWWNRHTLEAASQPLHAWFATAQLDPVPCLGQPSPSQTLRRCHRHPHGR